MLSGPIDFSSAPEEADVGDAEFAQGSLDPSGFVEGLSVGDLFGGLRRHRFATVLGAERG